MKKIIIFHFTLLVFVRISVAQTTISLVASIDTALKNNLLVKNELLKESFQKQLIQTASNIPLTNVNGEFGQINSAYLDNRFGISQSINFPTVYAAQKKYLTEEWKAATLKTSVQEAVLKKTVTETFYTYLFLIEKEKLLLQSDSGYSNFVKKTTLKFEKGETNILEKATAETQRGNIRLQLNQLRLEKELVLLQFQLLLNTSTVYLPFENTLTLANNTFPLEMNLQEHPTLKLLEQENKMSLAFTRLEKSKLAPDILFSYANMSMKGTGSDNHTYTFSKRFQSGMMGVGIPLFYGAQQARIKSSKIVEKITAGNYILQQKNLENQYQSALAQYHSQLENLQYYEKEALPNAALITKTALQQFVNGDINYLEWVMLTNQAIGIKSNYLDVLKLVNEKVIQLNFLINK